MTDWPRSGYDLGSSGFNAAETGSGNNISVAGLPSVALLWQSPLLDGDIYSQILIVGAYAYVTTRGGTFYKLDAVTGAIVGSYAIGSPSSSTPHIIGGIAYFGSDDGYFHAVTVSTMAVLWRVQTGLDTSPITCHPVVSGTRVFFGQGSHARALLIASGAESWSHAMTVPFVLTDLLGALGPVAFWGGNAYVASDGGVYEFAAAGTPGKVFGARAPCYGVAIQTHPNGTDFLCFESADHWSYAYDRASGERLWMENHQGGDMKSPIGLDLTRVGLFGTGFAVIGTHNWSIQPHNAEGGDIIWKRDATPVPVPAAAIEAGFALANGVLVGVWPPKDGRVAAFKLNDTRGGHTALWKYGTSTGNQGAGAAANKFYYSAPSIANGRIYCGANDSHAYCFA